MKLFHRYDKADPVKLHHYLVTAIHCLCEPAWMPILEQAVNDLGLPRLGRDFSQLLKMNVQDYHTYKEA